MIKLKAKGNLLNLLRKVLRAINDYQENLNRLTDEEVIEEMKASSDFPGCDYIEHKLTVSEISWFPDIYSYN